MAVIESVPGIEVTIEVDGEPLREYEDPDVKEDDDRTVTRYVEAESGKNFRIKIKISGAVKYKGEAITSGLWMDGKYYGGPIARKPSSTTSYGIGLWSGPAASETHVTLVQFSELETMPEHGDGLPKDRARVKDLGSIAVKLFHVERVSKISPRAWEVDPNQGMVSEKSLKGQFLTHRVGLADRKEEKCSIVHGKVLGNDPISIFVFKYRSRKALKDMMIIPRTPSPVPIEDRNPDDLRLEDFEELRENLRRQQRMRESTVEVKQELKRGFDGPSTRSNKRPRVTEYLELHEDGSITVAEPPSPPRASTETIALED